MKNEVNKFNEAIDELMNGLVKETVCNSESLKYILAISLWFIWLPCMNQKKNWVI